MASEGGRLRGATEYVGALQRTLVRVGASPDLALAGFVIVIVGMMLVPLPSRALDALIALNFALSTGLILVSLFVSDASRLATLPSLLLLATLFRLGLNVSVTRLVLLRGDAGRVVEAFGNVVVAGNVVVGAIVFLVLTLVQFIVIAKGSERVAEVAARFTLDALPGKQMSIDADLRAGAVSLEGAQDRRVALERESQLYGALDGAMKFVKGDAIAGLVVTAINIAGGLAIGVLQRGMSLKAAAAHYTVLTVGDGLAAQIPALLVSTTAGLVVTRVPGRDGVGLAGDIASQLLSQSRPLAVTALVLAAIAAAPGLPALPFLLLAGAAGAAAALRRSSPAVSRHRQAEPADALHLVRTNAPPVRAAFGAEVYGRVVAQGGRFDEAIAETRVSLFAELGVRCAEIVAALDERLAPSRLEISVGGIPTNAFDVDASPCWVAARPEELAPLGVAATRTAPGWDGGLLCWTSEEHATRAHGAGYRVGDALAFVRKALERTLRTHAAEFVGVQETREMLDALEETDPALVSEVFPRVVTLAQLAEVLRRLVAEEVSIRDLRAIVEALAVSAVHEKDPVGLVEQVRARLRRSLTASVTGGRSVLPVYALAPAVEDAFRAGARFSGAGRPLAIDPRLATSVVAELRTLEAAPRERSAPPPVVIAPQDIRRHVRALIESELPGLRVVSYQDLVPSVVLQPVGTVRGVE